MYIISMYIYIHCELLLFIQKYLLQDGYTYTEDHFFFGPLQEKDDRPESSSVV